MAAPGALRKLKKLGQKVGKFIKKGVEFVRDKLLDVVIKGIGFVKSGKADPFINLISTFVPGGEVAREVYDKVKLLLNHFDEEKVGQVLKLVLKGDFSHLNDLVNSIKSTGTFVKDNMNQFRVPRTSRRNQQVDFTTDEEGNVEYNTTTASSIFGPRIN